MGVPHGDTLAATFFGSFGGLFATLGLYVLMTGSALHAGIPTWAMVSAMGPAGVVAGCFAFVALFIGAGAILSTPGVGITSLALAVSLFFVSWSLFAQGNAVLTAIAGWAGLVSGALGLVSAAAVAIGSGLNRFMAAGPLSAFPALRQRATKRPTAV